MKVDDIIRFTDREPNLAAQWCASRNMTGKIVADHNGRFEIEAGLPYKIHAAAENIEFVASPKDAPPVSY